MDAKYICGIKTIPRKKRNVIDIVILICLWPVFLLSKLIPKNKRLYIYGSSLGWHFADNSKYLFLYASENVNSINSVFISKELSVVKHLHRNGLNAKYLYSLDGVITVLRAKKAFISHSSEDIHPVLLGGAETIQLWHGSPLKKICYDADFKNNNANAKIFNRIKLLLFKLMPYIYIATYCNRIIVASRYVVKHFQTALLKSEQQILALGQPRNDCLENNYFLDENLFPEKLYLDSLKESSDYIISWLPTHRLHSSINILKLFDDYSFDNMKFRNLLEHYHAKLIIKPHFIENHVVYNKFANCKNIIIYEHIDPYPLMRYTDVLITDYSSIFFDYLLLNRPVIFTPFDYKDYLTNNATLYYEYNQVTPGPKCSDWKEVFKHLETTLNRIKEGTVDPYVHERMEICRLFNDYRFNNSNRIVKNLFDI